MRNEGSTDITDRLLKWGSVLTVFAGLGIGTWLLEARHSIQSNEIKQLIQDENAKYSEQIEQNVTQNIQSHLRQFRDSINTDHRQLMQSNFRKDSLLLIVIPRMLEQVKDATNTTKRIESTLLSQEKNDLQPVWEYLRKRDERDSILSRDAQIMMQLRSINRQLMNAPKYDRMK